MFCPRPILLLSLMMLAPEFGQALRCHNQLKVDGEPENTLMGEVLKEAAYQTQLLDDRGPIRNCTEGQTHCVKSSCDIGKGIRVLANGCSKENQKELGAMMANCSILLDEDVCKLVRLTGKSCTAELCTSDLCNAGDASVSAAGTTIGGGIVSALASALLALLLLLHSHVA